MRIRFTIRDLLWLTLAVSAVICFAFESDRVFYRGGRSALPVSIIPFWGRSMIFSFSVFWLVVRLFRRR
jgi:hypothetical protein